MKIFLFTCMAFFFSCRSFAQTEAEIFISKQLQAKQVSKIEIKHRLVKYDYAKLFTQTANSVVYGFIGNDYQRLRIKFISVTKDRLTPDSYLVYGKSMVKNNIDEFHGTIKITNIRKLNITQHGCENEYKYKGFKGEYVILGEYKFSENSEQKHAGIFTGKLRSDFFIDKNNNVQYDDIENCADGFTNNQFVGQWRIFNGNLVKRCNWGDYRIPNSPGFDIGAGEFSPDDNYLKFGWQSVRDLFGSPLKQKLAKLIEEKVWWQ